LTLSLRNGSVSLQEELDGGDRFFLQNTGNITTTIPLVST
jgi:hypothetical protein